MSQTSGVLIVSPAAPPRNDFGADVVADFTTAKNYLKKHKPVILVFGYARPPEFHAFCQFALEHLPNSLWILACEGAPPSQIIHWNNTGRLHDLIDDFDDPSLEDKVRSAFEVAGEQTQRLKLVELFEGQSQQLKRLSAELEARVQKRHKTLRKSLETLEETSDRLDSFHKALLGIHRASSILQMEQTLNDAMHSSLSMVWVRVRFNNQSSLRRPAGGNVLAIEIPFANEKLGGEIMFAKPEGKKFSSAETDFLHELTEALALALSRLHKLEQAEVLKAQWQATFDSIPHALCLTTGEFEVLKLNRAFQQSCRSPSFRDLIGKDCFQVFFGKDFQPPQRMASPFTYRNSRPGSRETEHFEVVGETLGLTVDNQPVQLILIRSITEEVRFERRILEASKLAELGTIGSSIAHELNNPLGGMLSFLQLMLMDLRPSDPIHGEIKAMEAGVLRCRDIVLNLLSFARKQDLGEFAVVDLWEVVERALKLIALQLKSKGILIELAKGESARVLGSAGALTQATCNILQNSMDALTDRIQAEPLYAGKISLSINAHEGQYQLRITDNGPGIRPEYQTQIFNPLFTTRDPSVYGGMGLTTAFTIISEHHGTLEILSQTGSGTTAIISLIPASPVL